MARRIHRRDAAAAPFQRHRRDLAEAVEHRARDTARAAIEPAQLALGPRQHEHAAAVRRDHGRLQRIALGQHGKALGAGRLAQDPSVLQHREARAIGQRLQCQHGLGLILARRAFAVRGQRRHASFAVQHQLVQRTAAVADQQLLQVRAPGQRGHRADGAGRQLALPVDGRHAEAPRRRQRHARLPDRGARLRAGRQLVGLRGLRQRPVALPVGQRRRGALQPAVGLDLHRQRRRGQPLLPQVDTEPGDQRQRQRAGRAGDDPAAPHRRPQRLRTGRAGGDELALRRCQRLRLVGRPDAGALQHQPLQQCRIALLGCGRLPVVECALQLQPADEEAAFVVEPVAQQRPLAQQRLVRHLDLPAAGVVAARHQQPRADEGLQRAVHGGVELVPGGGAAAVDTLVVDAHQRADEGLAQRAARRVVQRRHQLVGAPAHGVFQRVQARAGITQRLVVGQPDHRTVGAGIGAGAAPQFAQREGQQRHGVATTAGAGVVHHRIDDARRDAQAGNTRRPFDHLRQARRRQRRGENCSNRPMSCAHCCSSPR